MNVLVALLDENHTHNPAAETWLAANIHHGWASCPLTQNGCVRILSQPAYPNALSVADAVMRLRTAISGPYHRFLADSVSLLDDAVVDCRRALAVEHGCRLVTFDTSILVAAVRRAARVYLLALAVEHGCRLVTFDTSILVAAVRRAARPSLVVI